MWKRLLAVTMLVVMTGCGDISVNSGSGPTLDTSSEDAFIESFAAMEESLEDDDDKLELFYAAIEYLEATRDGLSHETLKDLHGSTVDDIIATAE
jgi:hypothetical protein